MPDDQAACPASEQFLGEIETIVMGMQYHDDAITPGERANLDREPENRLDTCAIRVENGLFDHVGYLPRQVAAWLAPLVDAGSVRVDGYVPGAAKRASGHSANKCPITLPVFLCKKGQGLLSGRDVRNKLDALHEAIRRTCEEALGYQTAELILAVAGGLAPLTRQELLPRTGLLLARLPGSLLVPYPPWG